MMKIFLLLVLTTIVLTCVNCTRQSESNIDGFALVVFSEDIANIAVSSFSIKNEGRYRVQLRLDQDFTMITGSKIYDTYCINNGEKISMFDLLQSVTITFLDDEENEYFIDRKSVLMQNTANSDLYGKITVTEKYIFITLALFDLKKGKYFFKNCNLNEFLSLYNPMLIVGIGQAGTF